MIEFYHSQLCPRCRAVERQLRELLGDEPDLQVRSVEVLRHPVQTWKSGVRMIPALSCNGDRLSGLLLSRASVAAFVRKHARPRHRPTETT